MPPDKIDSLSDDMKPLVLAVLRRSEELLDENKALRARIAELEAKLGKPPRTPDNSSLPPPRGQKANGQAPASGDRKPRKGRAGVTLARSPGTPTRRATSARSGAPVAMRCRLTLPRSPAPGTTSICRRSSR